MRLPHRFCWRAKIIISSLLLAGLSQAATTVTTQSTSGDTSQIDFFTPSSTDLAQNGSATLLSSTTSNNGFFGDSGANDLGNGLITTANGTRGIFVRDVFPVVLNLTFDTTVNTLGYDISGITTYAAWFNNGASLANQLYTLEYSLIGDASASSHK